LHEKLSHLSPAASFFPNLDNLQFKGALHCEACLASMIDYASKPVPSGSKYAEVLQQLAAQVINLFLTRS
jgi:hypothetical protein